MSRRTTGAQPLLALASFATVLAVCVAWRGFTASGTWPWGELLATMAAVTVTGVACRATPLGRAFVPVTQLLVGMLVVHAFWGSGWLPTTESLRTAVEAFRSAVDSARTWEAPVPARAASIAPLLVVSALGCHVVVDAVAVTFGRVPVAGLPLLTAYTLPVSVLTDGVPWWVFALTGAGFLTMLRLEERARVRRWGLALAAPTGATGWRTWFRRLGVGPGSLPLGLVALALAVLVPLVVPTLGLDPFGKDGDQQSDVVRIANPLTDLKRDLVQGEDIEVLSITKAGPKPKYVRIAALDDFDGQAWRAGRRSYPPAQTAEGQVRLQPGLSPEAVGTRTEWQVQARDALESAFLPTALFVEEVRAGEDWRYDADALDFHAQEEGVTTAGLDYSLVEFTPTLTDELLAASPEAPEAVRDRYSAVPDDLPPVVGELATEVTRGSGNDFERAAALQAWFQSDLFSYSTDIDPGNGSDALVEFLSEGGREGYCEQFASAMAVMARTLGMPARVSVGFLDPTRASDGSFRFSTHDMHAWPEIYLEGHGWVLFEPTPTSYTRGVPSYTRTEDGSPTATASPTRTASPSASASPSPSPTASTTGPDERDDRDAAAGDGAGWWPWLVGGLVVLVLAGLVLAPRMARSTRSGLRWRHGGDPAETAWQELRDGAVDLGVAWPDGRSPRATARILAPVLQEPTAVVALGRIVSALEQSRYAPPGSGVIEPGSVEATELAEATQVCLAALREAATPAEVRRATWLPSSLVKR